MRDRRKSPRPLPAPSEAELAQMMDARIVRWAARGQIRLGDIFRATRNLSPEESEQIGRWFSTIATKATARTISERAAESARHRHKHTRHATGAAYAEAVIRREAWQRRNPGMSKINASKRVRLDLELELRAGVTATRRREIERLLKIGPKRMAKL